MEKLIQNQTITIILVICTILFILSLVMTRRQFVKKGGIIDKLNENMLSWKGFDFLKEHFNIERPKKRYSLFQTFKQRAVLGDFFYINVSEKLNLTEKKEYISVREKIRKYEQKWTLILWGIPFLMIAFTSFLTAHPTLSYIVLFSIYIPIVKLRMKPYKEEFLPIQKRILEKMYYHLFKENLPYLMIFLS